MRAILCVNTTCLMYHFISELMLGERFDNVEKADIFALGLSLYELVCITALMFK